MRKVAEMMAKPTFQVADSGVSTLQEEGGKYFWDKSARGRAFNKLEDAFFPNTVLLEPIDDRYKNDDIIALIAHSSWQWTKIHDTATDEERFLINRDRLLFED